MTMDYKEAWRILKEKVETTEGTPVACKMWVQGMIKSIESQLATAETPGLEERVAALETQMKFEDCSRVQGQKYIDGRLKELEEWRKTHLDLHVTIEHGLDKAEDRRMAGEEKLHIEIMEVAEVVKTRKAEIAACREMSIEKMAALEVTLQAHDKKFEEQAGVNRALVDDLKRLIGMIEAHIKKGFWGLG